MLKKIFMIILASLLITTGIVGISQTVRAEDNVKTITIQKEVENKNTEDEFEFFVMPVKLDEKYPIDILRMGDVEDDTIIEDEEDLLDAVRKYNPYSYLRETRVDFPRTINDVADTLGGPKRDPVAGVFYSFWPVEERIIYSLDEWEKILTDKGIVTNDNVFAIKTYFDSFVDKEWFNEKFAEIKKYYGIDSTIKPEDIIYGKWTYSDVYNLIVLTQLWSDMNLNPYYEFAWYWRIWSDNYHSDVIVTNIDRALQAFKKYPDILGKTVKVKAGETKTITVETSEGYWDNGVIVVEKDYDNYERVDVQQKLYDENNNASCTFVNKKKVTSAEPIQEPTEEPTEPIEDEQSSQEAKPQPTEPTTETAIEEPETTSIEPTEKSIKEETIKNVEEPVKEMTDTPTSTEIASPSTSDNVESKTTISPETGDKSNIYLSIGIASAIGLLSAIGLYKRRKDSE